MVELLSHKDVFKFEEAFILFDQDGDVLITSEELATAMRAFDEEPTEADLQSMINAVDLNGNGSIDFIEASDTEEDLKEVFRVLDKDEDGFISVADFRQFMTSFGWKLLSEEVDEVIRRSDVDVDRKLNFEEFVKRTTGAK